jgi:uncharacterized protein DUF2267
MGDAYEGFVDQVQERSGLGDRDTAEDAISATLDALASLLPADVGSHLAPRRWGGKRRGRRRTLIMGMAFGTGYVLGTRAGRERYHQIVASWHRLMGNPAVQQAAERGRRLAEQAGRKGAEAIGQARAAVTTRETAASGNGPVT